ncbi:interleukin-1 receptor type 2 [Brienomyrus brachyistius]|uniref:interleukin-1 receptor type 2 n=1 Tax=Brienomyrus brachyistius TaxID=42636 RepID=UPI0020B29A16|nr:interleukin-1 receptor type 2 [Brienomyrus brachyistius]
MTVNDLHIGYLVTLFVTAFSDRSTSLKMPQMPMRGGCFQVSEIEEFRLQGEAVVLRCPKMESLLVKRGLLHAIGHTYHFIGADMETLLPNDTGRVRTQDHHLWFLPARTTDTGNYTCIFRNASYCLAGTISLQVYQNKDPHLDVISYPYQAFPGHTGMIVCPNVNEFNRTGNLQWFKDSTPIVLSADHNRYHRHMDNALTIQNVSPRDAGFYTCELKVVINDVHYKVTRTIKLSVPAPAGESTTPSSMPSESPVEPLFLQPEIIFPSSSDIFEASIGSNLEIPCRVLIGGQSADSTEVTWLVDGLAIEESILRGRAFLGERTRGSHTELKLNLLELYEEDTRAVIKCVTQNPWGRQEVIAQIKLENNSPWLVVGTAGATAFLTMVFIFLYHLLKAQRKDYILARQNTMF